MNKEKIENLIEQKKEQLPGGVVVVTPRDNLPVEIQADWISSLLAEMYVEHGISKRRDSLLNDINNGNCKLWFAVRGEKPVGSAALVRQSDGSVEVGRAVSMEPGVGGLLMLMAAQDHFLSSESPVVAEVRISDNFGGVPSGEATQVVCFRHLELNPQATVPAFNHGNPNRQEMFVFSSSKKIANDQPAFFPNENSSVDLLNKTAVAMSKNGFQNKLVTNNTSESFVVSNWSVVETQPFSILVPDRGGVKFEKAMKEAENNSAFSLVPMSASPENTGSMLECLNQGFVPCGFDRNLDGKGFPVLLMGKLRKGTLLAPIKILSDVLDQNIVRAIGNIDRSFRKQ